MFRSSLLSCSLLLIITSVVAQPSIPDPLEPWTQWVLHKHQDINCPIAHNQADKSCIWPSSLSINLNEKGGRFEYSLEVLSDAWVTLPGDQQNWPTGIIDSRHQEAIVVRENNGQAETFLSSGQYTLVGNWHWQKMPRTLRVPANTGIISLVINDKIIDSPFLENATQLLLNASNSNNSLEAQDNLQLNVFRRIEDDVPLKMQTRITLDVSGKEREVHLSAALLPEFRLIAIHSDLPARVEKDGSLRVQVKAGSWTIQIESQSHAPLNNLSFHTSEQSSRLWPEQEIWVFVQQPALRSLQISGVPSIDPLQTLLPDEWRDLPAYLLDDQSQLVITELQGANQSSKNQLVLSRKMWLDFNGQAYTVKDSISGDLYQNWRLDSHPPFDLKSAKINGESQLVTQLLPTTHSGLEIRDRHLQLEAISRVANQGEIPVSGWSSVFNEVSTELILPPGWSLLTTTGTSYESGSWIEYWSLWNLFLVLIISLAAGKIIKPFTGLLAFVTLLFIYHRADSPGWAWLNLIAFLALVPYASGNFRLWLIRYLFLSFFVLALFLLPFSVQQAREFFYPQQEFPYKHMSDHYVEEVGSSFFDLFSSSSNKADYSETSQDVYSSSAPYENVLLEKTSINKRQEMKQKYDPSQIVQTGPGIPNWTWRSAHLRWNGPVVAEETTKFYLISPFWNRIGSLLSCCLSLLLAGLLLKHFLYLLKIYKPTTPETFDLHFSTTVSSILVFVAIIGISSLTSSPVQAQNFPSDQLLQELETRLTASAKCLPNCASIESVNLKSSPNALWLNMKVHAADKISFPLPGQSPHWWPNKVMLNGKTASLMQNAQRQLFIYLPKGTHQIELSARLDNRESIDINFELAAHQISTQLDGWHINGNSLNNIRSLQLQPLSPQESTQANEQLRPDPISPFVILRRSFYFDLEWNLRTEVIRVAPAEGVISLEIPLLAGESPLEGNTPLQNLSDDKQHLQIRFDQQTHSLYWNSRLPQTDSIQLKASENQPWVEIWEAQSSPVWHLDTLGIPATQSADVTQPPIWKPWPGELLSLLMTKPQAVKGESLVIESATLDYSPSARASTSRLELALKTSQANQFSFTLPDTAELNRLELNNQPLNLQPIQGVLHIPLQTGEQKLRIEWQTLQTISTLTRSPAINLAVPTANQSINVSLPERWIIYLGGSQVGPSVLIWGMLVVILLISFQLGRRQLTPLKTRDWVLLSLGIATVNLFALLLIAIWLLTLTWRSNLTQINSSLQFKWIQFGLFLLSIVSLILLIATIPIGLLSQPDMHIQGNASNGNYLRWYQDMSDGQLAQAWIISLPIWIYKLVMLGWSLWLASSLIKWLSWAWKALGFNGFWYWSGNKPEMNSQHS